jgi:hypothetical protein
MRAKWWRRPGEDKATGYEIDMFTKPILAILLAACGVSAIGATAEPPTEQPDKLPPTPPVEPEGQFFCCIDVDPKNYTGDDCTLIAEGQVNLCSNVLYCDKKWTKKDGKVICE